MVGKRYTPNEPCAKLLKMFVWSKRPPTVMVCIPMGNVKLFTTSKMSCSSRLPGENCSVPNVTARTVPPMLTPTAISGAWTGTFRSSRMVL
jgi:hypothetical protein